MIQQSSRCSCNQVYSFSESSYLEVHSDPSIDCLSLNRCSSREIFQHVFRLHCEFSRGREYEDPCSSSGILCESLDYREKEGCSLSRASSSRADDISASKYCRYSLCLDLSRRSVAEALDSLQKCRV